MRFTFNRLFVSLASVVVEFLLSFGQLDDRGVVNKLIGTNGGVGKTVVKRKKETANKQYQTNSKDHRFV